MSALAHRRTDGRIQPRPARVPAFTLVELLVVMAIIALLAALFLPSLASAKSAGKRAVCVSNLRQIGIATYVYSSDHNGQIPYGPVSPPLTSPAELYPSTGSPTSLLSLKTGAPVGLGLLLRNQLANTAKVFFCPANDQPLDAATELAKVGTGQAQGSYYYRHAGVTQLFATAGTDAANLRLENLGLNRDGIPIRALAMDTQFLCPPELAAFNVRPRTHHQQKSSGILFTDGSVLFLPNRDQRLTVDASNPAEIYSSLDKILQVFEQVDTIR